MMQSTTVRFERTAPSCVVQCQRLSMWFDGLPNIAPTALSPNSQSAFVTCRRRRERVSTNKLRARGRAGYTLQLSHYARTFHQRVVALASTSARLRGWAAELPTHRSDGLGKLRATVASV